ncbi:MAG: cysteine desulfurase family protein [Acidobacteriota bacterium]
MYNVYFDYSATTPLNPQALESMMPYLQAHFGNPSSTHEYGRNAREAVEKARRQVAEFLGAGTENIIFTSGGTEANNTAILGAAYANWTKGNHIITTSIEHRAVLDPCRFLESQGFRVTYLPVDESGMVEIEELEKAITADTTLISVMYANNEIGTIQPVEDIGRIARNKGIIYHCDAVQAAGRVPIDVNRINCDLLSISAHKFYGPKGAGCLYIRSGLDLMALLRGGGQERNLRAGTENVAGIVGFGEACRIALAEMGRWTWELIFMRDMLIDAINERIPGAYLNGHRYKRLPGHVSFCFDNIVSTDLLSMLDDKGIAVSSGSACHAKSPRPSHVLKALGYSDELALSALRITLGAGNNDDEIEYFLAILPDIISVIRDVAPTRPHQHDCPCEEDIDQPRHM